MLHFMLFTYFVSDKSLFHFAVATGHTDTINLLVVVGFGRVLVGVQGS